MSIQINQIRKLRRRVEECLRKADVYTIIKIAQFLGVRIQKDLKNLDVPLINKKF